MVTITDTLGAPIIVMGQVLTLEPSQESTDEAEALYGVISPDHVWRGFRSNIPVEFPAEADTVVYVIEYTWAEPVGRPGATWASDEADNFCPGYTVFDGFLQLDNDVADHDIGNIVLTMTDQGTLGFTDDSGTLGSGLIYPAGQSNNLFIGGLWVARDASYVASRDYAADPDQEWSVESNPDGHMRIVEPGPNADEEIEAGFNDDDGSDPFDLYIRQESWAFDSPESDDDFVIVRYFIHNRGQSSQTDLRVGMFLDLDLDPFSSNTGSTDSTRQLAYMNNPSDLHLGVRLLENGGDSVALSNLTLIHNPTFVYPTQYVPDADKFGFLSALDPLHSVPDASAPDDYSLLVAAGPFGFAPGESTEVAFAITGGLSLGDLLSNVDRAQQVYSPTVAIAGTSPDAAGATRLLEIKPNPFNPATTIQYDVARAGPVRMMIYDTAGRAMRTLIDGHREAGRHELVWDGRIDSGGIAASGVYYLRLQDGDATQSRPLVLLK